MDWQAWRMERARALPRAGNIGVQDDVPGELRRIQTRALKCPQCVPLVSKAQWVASRGGTELPVMIVGEAPGWEEAREHLAATGPPGKALRLLLASVGLPAEQLWITHAVRCRSPKRDNVTQALARNCQVFLWGEILTLLPSRVVLLGRFAWESVHGEHKGALAGLRQKWAPIPQLQASGFEVPSTFAYHPAAGLRDGTYLEWLREDLAWLKEGLNDPWEVDAGPTDYGE